MHRGHLQVDHAAVTGAFTESSRTALSVGGCHARNFVSDRSSSDLPERDRFGCSRSLTAERQPFPGHLPVDRLLGHRERGARLLDVRIA